MALISIVLAVSTNGVIGRDGDMPWKLSTDLKRFKALTLGKPLVLGRKTFESFGSRPLPGRPHVVISRSAEIVMPMVETVRSLEEGLERAREIAEDTGVNKIFVIGGGEIYRQALPLADRLYVTHVEVEIANGDTFFPPVDLDVFDPVAEERFPAGERDSFPTRYVIYQRKPAS